MQQVDPTGVPNLDAVLGGGLPRRSLVIVVGPPGSGKTTLASQMGFAAAQMGKRVLVFTALSEPTNKLIGHLRTFTFFEESLVGSQIEYMSLQQFLINGLAATADEVVAISRRARADLVLIDGFRGVRGSEIDPQAAREFLYDVGTKLSILGATTIITSESDARDPSFFPEATTADVIIGLHYKLVGVRTHRAIEVVKVRGARMMPGLHALRLTDAGAAVYPRLEARVLQQTDPGEPISWDDDFDASETAAAWYERAPFGLTELDALLDGGLPLDTTTLLVGSLGAGKTLLGLQFALNCVAHGEPTLYLGFRESRSQMLRKADVFAMGTRMRKALLPGGGLTLQRWAPIEIDPDVVADRLLHTLDQTGAHRLVLDGVGELQRSVMRTGENGRVSDYLSALVEALATRGVTTLFIAEHPKVVVAQLDFSADPISALAENVLLLQQVYYRSQLHRVLSVVKMRYSSHDFMLREFTITTPEGIQVLQPFESNEEVLEGIAHEQGTGEITAPPNKAQPTRPAGGKRAGRNSHASGEHAGMTEAGGSGQPSPEELS